MNTFTGFISIGWALLLSPLAVLAQTGPSTSALAPPSKQPAASCSIRNAQRGAAWQSILVARGLEREAAKSALAALQDSLAAEALAHPDEVQTQYLLAAAMGSRADVEGGREKVRAAKAAHAQATRVLAMDPSHPGAQYLLGRLHAAVMRMDKVTRFLATRLLGGAELSGASWEEAQRLLEAAAEGDPCVADYHYELARVYAERGEPARAIRQLKKLFAYCDAVDEVVTTKVHALEAELGRGGEWSRAKAAKMY